MRLIEPFTTPLYTEKRARKLGQRLLKITEDAAPKLCQQHSGGGSDKTTTTEVTSVVLKNVHTLTHGTEAAVVLVVVQNADTEGQWRLDKNGVSDR